MKNLNRPEKPEKQKPQNDFVYRDIEEKMNKIMGTKVVIKTGNTIRVKLKLNIIHRQSWKESMIC